MLNFKIIKSENGDKVVVNLASIDAIITLKDDTATIRIGELQIPISKATAEHLEKALGATA